MVCALVMSDMPRCWFSGPFFLHSSLLPFLPPCLPPFFPVCLPPCFPPRCLPPCFPSCLSLLLFASLFFLPQTLAPSLIPSSLLYSFSPDVHLQPTIRRRSKFVYFAKHGGSRRSYNGALIKSENIPLSKIFPEEE